jgi:hypothetical protein
MSTPTACIRCKGTDLVEAVFAGAEGLRLVVDDEHTSPVGARVCLTCGAVLLTATQPGALRATPEPHRDVQEFDF